MQNKLMLSQSVWNLLSPSLIKESSSWSLTLVLQWQEKPHAEKQGEYYLIEKDSLSLAELKY